VGKFNPIDEILHVLKMQAKGRQSYYFKKLHTTISEAAKARAEELTMKRGIITCMTYLERKKQLVFCTSNGFLSFWDAEKGCLVGFVSTGNAHIGICVCNDADCILTWPDETGDTVYRVWDINTRKLRCTIDKHRSRALNAIEVGRHRCVVSSTIDREVIVWPTYQLKKVNFSSARDNYLRGHNHAITSLLYAPDRDLLFGSGFDYDIYAWDVASQLLTFKLSGHRAGIASIFLMYTPTERVGSVDEEGVLKVWNIDRSESNICEVLYSLTVERNFEGTAVMDSTCCFNEGSTIAVLADNLYFVDRMFASSSEARPLPNAICVSHSSDIVCFVTSKVFSTASLVRGSNCRRYEILCDERIEETSRLSLPKHNALKEISGKRQDLQAQDRPFEKLDEITAVVSDPTGKKLIVGTSSGHLFIYDTASFGLLTKINLDVTFYREQGAITALAFVGRDELVVAGFAGGAVVVCVGCFRNNDAANAVLVPRASKIEAASSFSVSETEQSDVAWTCNPVPSGGRPRLSPALLRCNAAVHESNIVSIAVSEDYNLIAVAGGDGTVRLLDYLSLQAMAVYSAPRIDSKVVEVVQITFLEHAPILIGVDSMGRITLWSCPPMECNWVLTWSSKYRFSGAKDAMFDENDDHQLHSISGQLHTNPLDGSGNSLWSVKSAAWNVEEIDKSEDCKPSNVNCDFGVTALFARWHWSIIVGDEHGSLFVFDVTQVVHDICINASELAPVVMHSPKSAYQQHHLRNFRENVEGNRLRNIEHQLKIPIGSNMCRTNIMMKDLIGFRGTTISSVRLHRCWDAFGVGGVAAIHVLQSSKGTFPATPTTSTEWRSLEPYGILTASDRGDLKLWSWSGSYIGQMTENDASICDQEANLTEELNANTTAGNITDPEAEVTIDNLIIDGDVTNAVLVAKEVSSRAGSFRPSGWNLSQLMPIDEVAGNAKRGYFLSRADALLLWVRFYLKRTQVLDPANGVDDDGFQSTHSLVEADNLKVNELFKSLDQRSHFEWFYKTMDDELQADNQMSILASIRAFSEHDDRKAMGRSFLDRRRQVAQAADTNLHSTMGSSECKVKFPHYFQEQQHNLRKPHSSDQFQDDLVNLSNNTITGASTGRRSSLFQLTNDTNYRGELDKSIRDTSRAAYLQIAKQGYTSVEFTSPHETNNSETKNADVLAKFVPDVKTIRAKKMMRPSSANSIPKSASSNLNTFCKSPEAPKKANYNDLNRIDSIISNIEKLSHPFGRLERDFSQDQRDDSLIGDKPSSHSLQARILKFQKTVEEDINPRATSAYSKRKLSKAIDSGSKLDLMASSSKLPSTAPLIHKRMGSERDTLYSERGRTRYGPYKARDVHLFIDFLDRLDGAAHGFLEGRAASDLRTYPVELVLNQPEILRKPVMARELIRLSGANNSIVTLSDLLSLLFPHASSAEKQRMRSLTIARRAFSQFVAMLSSPSNAMTSQNEANGVIDVSSVQDKTSYMAEGTTLLGKMNKSLSRLNGVKSPAKAKSQPLKASWREPLDGWSVPREYLMKLKKELDLLFDVETGTITGNDVSEIFKWHPRLKGANAFQNTEMYVRSLGYTLQDEFNGAMVADLLTAGFRLSVVEK
jgi:WD40 repeat protein